MDGSESATEELWENHLYEGCFAIDLPKATMVSMADESTIAVFALPSTEPSDEKSRTELLAGIFAAKDHRKLTQEFLKSELERFMETAARAPSYSIEIPIDFDKPGYWSYQAVAPIDELRWWVARIYGRADGEKFLLIHWNGRVEEMESTILTILLSVDPLV